MLLFKIRILLTPGEGPTSSENDHRSSLSTDDFVVHKEGNGVYLSLHGFKKKIN